MSALKAIREARGLTQKQLADRLNTTDVSISRYEDQDRRLTLPLMRKLAKELNCTIAEIAEEEPLRLKESEPAGSPVEEVDVRAGLGPGGLIPAEYQHTEDGQTVGADPIRGEWRFPDYYIANELRARPDAVRIIELEGDSMSPTLLTGDRAMVDTTRRMPTPPGLFAVWDGFGVVVKRLEIVPNSDPPSVRIISDNPKHDTVTRTADETNIIGRVIWYARKL